MALSFMLSGAGHVPTELITSATVVLDKEGAGFVIKSIALDLQARVPGITEPQFLSLAEGAKKDCPVSKALAAVEITLKATLLS
jgi:osmotically inducible protein OsmC